MKRNLVMFLVFLPSFSIVNARADPPFASISAPISSPFFASTQTYSPGIQIVSSNHHMSPNQKLYVALIATSGVLGAIILVMACLWIYHCKKIKNSDEENMHSSELVKGVPSGSYVGKFNFPKEKSAKTCASLMDYEMLKSTTNNFQESEILGKGGFSCVYKGKLEENLCVAVKKLKCATQDAIREFETEVDLLSKMKHPNIISLLGYSIQADTRLIVYDLMENGSLEDQLHGSSRGSTLTWDLRMKIALGITSGLEYLHECCNPPVIHRDLKSSNILLDANFNAKISDFGLAVADGAQNSNEIKLSGTVGYVAPEYLLDGKLTDKSDVYAFGVVLLELLLGRRSMEKLAQGQCQSIVSWAMPQLTDRSNLPNIVDPVIRNTMDLKHLYQVAAVAVLCVQPEPSYRPLITDVLHSLIPLVPIELGGTLRASQHTQCANFSSSEN